MRLGQVSRVADLKLAARIVNVLGPRRPLPRGQGVLEGKDQWLVTTLSVGSAVSRGVRSGFARRLFPQRPEPVDIAVMQPEQRVETGGFKSGQVAVAWIDRTNAADKDMNGTMRRILERACPGPRQTKMLKSVRSIGFAGAGLRLFPHGCGQSLHVACCFGRGTQANSHAT